MPALLIVCHNDECADSVERKPTDPKPMVCTGETFSAWTFVCSTCRAQRVVTKNLAGGTFGQGRRDDGTGPSTAKGPLRYRPGWRAKA